MHAERREHHSFPARLAGHYVLHVPEHVEQRSLLVLTLHGYGSNPEVMLRLTAALVGPQHVIASLQGPNQFYLAPDDFDCEIGYGWGTRKDMEASIELHHEMVLRTLEELKSRFGMGADRALLAGFSQPVSMNYRFAATCPEAIRGVIAVCGGLPGDWEEREPPKVAAAVLHIARDEDRYYPRATALQFAERLPRYAGDVEFHLLPGGHRVPSQAGPIVERWIERVFFATADARSQEPGFRRTTTLP